MSILPFEFMYRQKSNEPNTKLKHHLKCFVENVLFHESNQTQSVHQIHTIRNKRNICSPVYRVHHQIQKLTHFM